MTSGRLGSAAREARKLLPEGAVFGLQLSDASLVSLADLIGGCLRGLRTDRVQRSGAAHRLSGERRERVTAILGLLRGKGIDELSVG